MDSAGKSSSAPRGQKFEPLISIVIPFFNAAPFIQEAINSVLSQSYTHWELLLVDDGSTDGSAAVASRYAAQQPDKIRLLAHPGNANRGGSASRNVAHREAKGDFVAYLDADDVWLPGKLEQQVALIAQWDDVDMIMGATTYWRSWSREGDDHQDRTLQVGVPQDRLYEVGELIGRLYPVGHHRAPSVNTVIVRRAIVEKVGGWEESFQRVFTDQGFLVKVYLQAKVYVSSQVWDLYRQRAESSSHAALASEGHPALHATFLEWFEAYLLDNGLRGTKAWKLVQRRLLPYRHPHLARLVRAARKLLRRTKG